MLRCLLGAALPALLVLGAKAQTLPGSEPASLLGTYRLTYQPDSTDPTKRTELQYLLLGKAQSQFESQGKRAFDSLLVAAKELPFNQETTWTISDRINALPRTRFNFTIYKTTAPRHLYHDERLGRQHYRYEEPAAPTWTLTPATATVAGYACQRATTTLGGRQWEAWFTRDIPVSDGPYTFCGLPGLIVKVGDTRQHYVFELLRLAKPATGYLITPPAQAPTSTDRIAFRKAKADHDAHAVEQMIATGNLRFDSSEQTDAVMQRVRENAKRRNNPLELR